MNMHVQWNRVTWYSQIIAIVLFVGIFALGVYLGEYIETVKVQASQTVVMTQPKVQNPANVATFKCDGGKEIQATFNKDNVQLSLSDGRAMTLPHAMSADGARYANADESVVFWNVGRTAFMTEGSSTTFANCNQIAAPVGS